MVGVCVRASAQIMLTLVRPKMKILTFTHRFTTAGISFYRFSTESVFLMSLLIQFTELVRMICDSALTVNISLERKDYVIIYSLCQDCKTFFHGVLEVNLCTPWTFCLI